MTENTKPTLIIGGTGKTGRRVAEKLAARGVPTRVVMHVMGWSQPAMTTRYQHVPDEVRRGIAAQLGGLLWGRQNDGEEAGKEDSDGVSART